MTGWIKLHRSITSWEWYSDLPCRILFLHLLVHVNYHDKPWRGSIIRKGQYVTSYPKLAVETGLSVRQLRTALKKLHATGEVTVETTHTCSVISLVKYSEYQDEGQACDMPDDTRDVSPATTTKEVKKEKEKDISKDISKKKKSTPHSYPNAFDRFWLAYPNQHGRRSNKPEAFKQWKIAITKTSPEELMDSLSRYCTSSEVRDGFEPFPQKWLKNERWLEEFNTHGNTSNSTQQTRTDRAREAILRSAKQLGYA